jgi:hypothetical protein
VYRDIFDLIDHQPRLKINISDSNQSFTPLLTGNINWVASPSFPHFWHLFIRFPKTNIVYEWKDIVYTNDVAAFSKHIEEVILQHPGKFYDNNSANGDELYEMTRGCRFQYKTCRWTSCIGSIQTSLLRRDSIVIMINTG